MIVVAVAITRGISAHATASQRGLASKTTGDLFASYTPLEKKLLFPILVIVWLLVKCLQQIDRKNNTNSNASNNIKSGGGNVEEGSIDDDISSWGRGERNNTKITPLTKNQEKEGELDAGNKTQPASQVVLVHQQQQQPQRLVTAVVPQQHGVVMGTLMPQRAIVGTLMPPQ